ncbi:MAG TPA: type II toxin-antitoxin system PemK/MazF family toxin [Thermoanaerobaculia bacterium]|nr:type II toxin-antitoxin system PemK/MazF family toxin [Thermoanaerobaculia bacterium]
MIKRGDVFLVNLDPVVGSEIGKTRPAVVVQNELANRSSRTVTVIPISSSVERVFPFQVRIPAGEGGLSRESKALCEQVRTLSRERLLQCLGELSPERLNEIRTALDRHLWF